MQTLQRDEYADFYQPYVDQAPKGDWGDALTNLRDQVEGTARLCAEFGEARGAHRYEPGKWSVKEVVGHLVDVERVFGYRAAAFSRGDTQPIPGMDQEVWIPAGGYDRRPLSGIVDELRAARASNLALFESFDDEQGRRMGTASGRRFSARSFAWILAGHERHHRTVLEQRYR